MTDPALRFDDEGDATLAGVQGPRLLVRLHALLRAGRLYDVTNQAFQRHVQELNEALAEIHAGDDDALLIAVADHFYLNGVRVRLPAAQLAAGRTLMGDFERRYLAGLRFLRGVTSGEIERFVQLLLASEDPSYCARLGEMASEAGILNVVPVRLDEVHAEQETHVDEPARANVRGRARRSYGRALQGTRAIVAQAAITGKLAVRHAKRLVQPIVDGLMHDEYAILGLTAVKQHDEYTYAHSVNVCVLSISIGQVLGLARPVLANLGVSALLHDIGKVTVPPSVLQKPGKLDDAEWQLVQRHPMEGVKMLTRLPGLSSLTLDAMRVTLEHHMNRDSSGYPRLGGKRRQAMLSRVVAVADCFDAVTAHRPYRPRPMTGYEALHHVLGPARDLFDPAPLYALVRTVGLYPPGTLLQTESGHVVMSEIPNSSDPRRPDCRVLRRPDGSQPPDDPPVRWEPMPPEEHVVRVLRPEEWRGDVPTPLAA